jgi:hypothetical protein
MEKPHKKLDVWQGAMKVVVAHRESEWVNSFIKNDISTLSPPLVSDPKRSLTRKEKGGEGGFESVNLDKTESKFRRLIGDFQFSTIKQLLGLNSSTAALQHMNTLNTAALHHISI